MRSEADLWERETKIRKFPGPPYGYKFDPLPVILKKTYYRSPALFVSTGIIIFSAFIGLVFAPDTEARIRKSPYASTKRIIDYENY